MSLRLSVYNVDYHISSRVHFSLPILSLLPVYSPCLPHTESPSLQRSAHLSAHRSAQRSAHRFCAPFCVSWLDSSFRKPIVASDAQRSVYRSASPDWLRLPANRSLRLTRNVRRSVRCTVRLTVRRTRTKITTSSRTQIRPWSSKATIRAPCNWHSSLSGYKQWSVNHGVSVIVLFIHNRRTEWAPKEIVTVYCL